MQFELQKYRNNITESKNIFEKKEAFYEEKINQLTLELQKKNTFIELNEKNVVNNLKEELNSSQKLCKELKKTIENYKESKNNESMGEISYQLNDFKNFIQNNVLNFFFLTRN